MPDRQPSVTSHQDMLAQWAVTLERGLETMIADARAGRLVDDTLVQDYNYIRHLMGRREVIVGEILQANSPHRGPGTPLYHDLGGADHVDH